MYSRLDTYSWLSNLTEDGDSEEERIPTVAEVLQQHSQLSIDMKFSVILDLQQWDVNHAWMVSRNQKTNDKARLTATVQSIAYGRTLQQLGDHKKAKSSLDRLMFELGLPAGEPGLNRIHDSIGTELGDQVLLLHFRLKPDTLGSVACGQNFQTALDIIKNNRYKEEIFWRFQIHKILAGINVEVTAFEQQLFELTGGNPIPGNTAIIPHCQVLSRAANDQVGSSSRYWDEAVHWATQSFYGIHERLFDYFQQSPDRNQGHWITHSCIKSLDTVLSIKFCIAKNQCNTSQMRDIAMLWDNVVQLRYESQIHSKADGFREWNQIQRAIFGERGFNIDSMVFQEPKAKGSNEVPLIDRLRDLTTLVSSL